MRLSGSVLLLILFCSAIQATTWYVRTDGGTTTQCTGTTNAAYSSGTGQPCAYLNPADAITAATCDDIITFLTGQTWDTASPYVLPNKSCTSGHPITITSSDAGLLPSARVSPSNASSMARIRATGTNGVFQTATNAGFWTIDGLNLTDNAAPGTQSINWLIDCSTNTGANNITVTRNLMYPKEALSDPTNRNRPLARGFQFDGVTAALFKWNYAYGFTQRDGLGASANTTVVGCFACSNLTVTDNYCDGQYTSFFTGGVEEPSQYSATLSGVITSTQADFSITTGLVNNVTYGRFDFTGQGTLSATSCCYTDAGSSSWSFSTLTRTSGAALINFDGSGANTGFHIRLVDVGGGPTYRGRLKAVATNAYTVVWEYGASAPAGTYNWTVSEVAQVTGIAGGTVSFSGTGPNALTQAPISGSTVVWRHDQVVHDVSLTKNTFNIDMALAQAEHAATGNSPKGWFEFKAGDGITIDGNYFTGYPSVIGITQHSNEGHTPWTKVKNLTVSNNFVNSTYDANGYRQFIILALIDPFNSDEPGLNTTITNNLVINCIEMLQSSGNNITSVTHNTLINNYGSAVYNPSTVNAEGGPAYSFTFTDNISAYLAYGLNCQLSPFTQATCWPSGVFNHNVVVDNASAGVTVNSWGTNSILAPVPTAFSQVGFVNTTGNDYRLSNSSAYKGAGNVGADPGVNWTNLVNALGFDPSGGTGSGAGGNTSWKGPVTIH